MPDVPFPAPDTEPLPFDLKAVESTIAAATIGFLEIALRAPGTPPSPDQAAALSQKIRDALMGGMRACGEVTRIRTELATLRDGHRPQPHADPTKPGALCAACSVHGSIVAWPCATWSAAERILNHGQA